MSRAAKWLVTGVASVVAFGLCWWLAAAVKLPFLSKGDADRWVVDAAFASAMTACVMACGAWWAGWEKRRRCPRVVVVYAFLVRETDFDDNFGRIRAHGLSYRLRSEGTPMHERSTPPAKRLDAWPMSRTSARWEFLFVTSSAASRRDRGASV